MTEFKQRFLELKDRFHKAHPNEEVELIEGWTTGRVPAHYYGIQAIYEGYGEWWFETALPTLPECLDAFEGWLKERGL